MTALLTDNLPLLACAPNGIKKLRELILELAVRGKLVEQDASDEPASELLKHIAEEKARLVEEGKIKKPKPLQDIEIEEHLFGLPKGWMWQRFGDLCSYIQRGKGPSYVEISNFPVISQKCVRWAGLDISQARFIDPESLSKYEEVRHLQGGDILWNSTGTGTIGRASVVPISVSYPVLVADSHVTVMRPLVVLPAFMWRWIQSPSVQSKIEGSASGTTNQIELNTSTVIMHLMPVPPLAEQHRIVAKVDELMALCDRLEAQQADAASAHAQLVQALLDSLTQASDATDFATNWQRLAEHFHTLFTTETSIDALKKTLLQLAVMGKLVPQDHSDEPADELIERIGKERAKLVATGQLKKQKQLELITDSEKYFPPPSGWVWTRFGTTIQSLSNGLYKPAGFYTDSGIISLRMYNIQDGAIVFTDVRRVNIDEIEIDQYRLQAGDLLVNRVNSKDLVGKTAVIPEINEPLVYESMNMRARPFSGFVNSLYLNLFMRTRLAKDALLSHAKEAIGQASLNQGQISSLPLPLPPLTEQHRIVAKVDQLMTLCDQLKTRLTQARQLNQQLASTLVEQAVA